MAHWPRFPVTVVGSWPRPSWLLDAMKRKRSDLHTLQDEATLLARAREYGLTPPEITAIEP